MIALEIGEIARIIEGDLDRSADAAVVVSGAVHTDSRKVEHGAIFFALPGAVTDGHEFAASAAERGAALVIAERPIELDVPVIVVADGYAALAALAREVVARVRARGTMRVVAITGSNGKTTTKNMLRVILAGEGETVAPDGSFNNHVGAPISMLGVTDETRYLIVEMGAGAPGDIGRLISIVTPDIGVVLKVGLAHVGEFGGIEEVRLAKSDMVTELPESAIAVLNGDDHRVASMADLTAARIVTFGTTPACSVWADEIVPTSTGTRFAVHANDVTSPVSLRILGEHHVMNGLAALTIALELGVPLDRAIPRLESLERAERWRMEIIERADGVTVINDAYNASPDSMAAALKTLAELTRGGRRSVAVLGEMAELGPFADDEHDRIGRLAVRLNVQKLVVVGHRARHIHNAAGLEGSWDGESMLVGDADEAYDVLRAELREGDIVLVKSSGSAGLRFLGDRIAGVTE